MGHAPLALPQEPADGIAGWAADLVDALGAPGAGLAVALENLFPPLPSEVILPLTGFAAGQGVISLTSALFRTTLGSVVGAVVLYGIGMLFGRERAGGRDTQTGGGGGGGGAPPPPHTEP
ncbi:DedA family protein, partial [Streptomyces sp. NPDC060022]|uniref:DedA family protein n=1 Tax=Streptomyces sp. NPDC060022 TaxID=3347039 RepID=UPI003698D249